LPRQPITYFKGLAALHMYQRAK